MGALSDAAGLTPAATTFATAPILFSYTGSDQFYTIPTSGTYEILVAGAQGGNSSTFSGGLGADVGGLVQFTAGENLIVTVGGQGAGTIFGAGGGGGVFWL